jgi:hypothetical protein
LIFFFSSFVYIDIYFAIKKKGRGKYMELSKNQVRLKAARKPAKATSLI